MILNNKNNYLPEFLNKIFDILEKHNIHFWLEAGSLLKGIRDKTILNSSDLDLAATSKNTENILLALKELSTLGYNYKFNGGYPMLEDMVTIYLPQKINKIIHLDIYIYQESEKFYFRRSYHKPLANSKSRYLFYLSKKIFNLRSYDIKLINNDKKKYFHFSIYKFFAKILFLIYEYIGVTFWYIVPLKYFSKFKKFELHGRNFNIPVHSEKYLEFRYGNDWTSPIDRSVWFKEWKNKNNILKKKKLRTNLEIKKYWIKF